MHFPIRSVAQQTGLSPHTIRAWERRYAALVPNRSDSNRRLYSQAEVERLKLLRRAVASGHSISQVASLSDETLRNLLRDHPGPDHNHDGDALSQCEAAVNNLDAERLEQAIHLIAMQVGIRETLISTILPLLQLIDRRWSAGTLSIAQEHMVSAVLRTYLEKVRTGIRARAMAPRLLVTTPKNQHHEIGALIVSVIAALDGWNVTYLGPNLPALEIANAAKQSAANAIGLSLVFPLDDPDIGSELLTLREAVGLEMPILVGGRATPNYQQELAAIDATVAANLDALEKFLATAADRS